MPTSRSKWLVKLESLKISNITDAPILILTCRKNLTIKYLS